MKAIGGFFGLELPSGSQEYHSEAVALTNGRCCLRHIVESTNPSRIHVPAYCCDAVFKTLAEAGMTALRYGLNERMEPAESPRLAEGELYLYVNYFGIKTDNCRRLETVLGRRLIIDNTQAFFVRAIGRAWSFNSARKFFGVPDGGYLYGANEKKLVLARNAHPFFRHLIEKLCGRDNQAYASFQASEASLSSKVLAISQLSDRLLSLVDYETVAARRRENFGVYQELLEGSNAFPFVIQPDDVPFCYPLVCHREVTKQRLYEQGFYVPTFWPELITGAGATDSPEATLARRLLPLPVDHRYGADDCRRVGHAVLALLAEK